MKQCIRCAVVKPLSEFGVRRASVRDGLQFRCKACIKECRNHSEAATWYARHKDYESRRHAESYKKSDGAVLARNRAYRSEHLTEEYARAKSYRATHREQIKAKDDRWIANNRDRHNAKGAYWRAARHRATTAWSNKFFIGEAYSLAMLRTKMLGFPWHVDHVVPLKSSLVCGLHVEHNLAVIPGKENCRKRNWHWPDEP